MGNKSISGEMFNRKQLQIKTKTVQQLGINPNVA